MDECDLIVGARDTAKPVFGRGVGSLPRYWLLKIKFCSVSQNVLM